MFYNCEYKIWNMRLPSLFPFIIFKNTYDINLKSVIDKMFGGADKNFFVNKLCYVFLFKKSSVTIPKLKKKY